MKLGKDLEGSDRGLMRVLSWNLPERTEENHAKPLVITVDIPAEIPREYILSMSVKYYR
jgi:hypothetical protein